MVRSGFLVSGVFSTLALIATRPANAQVQSVEGDFSPSTLAQSERDGEGSRVLRYDTATHALGDSRSTSGSVPMQSSAAVTADDGLFSPYTLSPRIESGRTWLKAVGGYDSAVGDFRARSSAESAVTSWLAFRVDFEHGPSIGIDDRVGLAGRIQFLDQERHGIDGGAVLGYQPNDFRREGNVVGGLLVARRFGRIGLMGSALFGSDPEGDDQEIDGRLAGQFRVLPTLQLGVDNRFRTVATDDAKRIGTTTTDWEFPALPNAVLVLGPGAIIAEAGLSSIQQTSLAGEPDQRKQVRSGFLATAGAGTAF